MNWESWIAWIVIALCVLAIPFAVMIVGWRIHAGHKRWDWWKDSVVPVVTSLVVAVVGLCFAIQSEFRQHADAEAQRQTSIMRELMLSQERRDAFHLLATDWELNNHFARYSACQEQNKEKEKKKEPIQDTTFDEEAAFFFYCKHRASLVNLRATEGNLVFHRLWMEDAFEGLATYIVSYILDANEGDPEVSPEVEAVTYKWFGVKTESQEAQNEQTKRLSNPNLLLWDFHQLLNGKGKFSSLDAEELGLMKAEFQKFQKRLHDGKIDPHEIMDAVLAMEGLVEYSINGQFADWYRLQWEEPPDALPPAAPEHFLESPPKDYKGNWIDERKHAWTLIEKVTP